MKKGSPNGFGVICLVLFALAWMCVPRTAKAQADQTTTSQLLGKAKALETRGRMDMAKQTWQQVLLVDPNNSDALAGMARAAKLEGKTEEANQYLNKMRAINPNDPNIARVEQMGTAQDMSGQLQEAGRLAQAGQYARAMTILRQVYGTTPPAGDAALSYYETEAATDDGRPHAIAGLRELVDKYPQDSRYQISLGKILTYNPRTRAEGRKLLEKHPNDPGAVEALRQSLVWDAQNPATAGDLRAYLAKHKDAQLSTALAQADAAAKRGGGRVGPAGPAPQTPEEIAAQAEIRERNAEEQAAYNSLNAKRFDEAEARFQAIVAKEPQNPRALAGLGYVRMSQSNFGGAISYLEEAIRDGSKDAGVEKALRDSRFFYTMQVATAALNENDLATAEAQFGNASHMRPNDPSPLLGLGGTLLKAQQPASAVGVFTQYVKMSPNDKAAWRGLFMAQYGASQFAAALETDRRVPLAVKKELMRDPDYLRTLASVYQALGRDADAQRVLHSALDLPFPADSRGMKADMQLQYAALLDAAGRKEQAAGLYRQVLEADSTNINAYDGLIDTEHALGHDDAAYQAIQSMAPQTYDQAMQQPGFPSTVAAIYQSQGHYELAQQVLETFLANEQQQGLKPTAAAELQLAGIYMQHGDTAHAFPLYRDALLSDPNKTEAWNGLLTSLHAAGRDQDALAEIQQIPPNVRLKLESDPAYLQTVGSIYSGLNDPRDAMAFFARVQQHYAFLHIAVPVEIDIQEAWLLFNAKNDAGLFHELMFLGGREKEMTDQQAMTVQTIWANWAVRRANQNIEEGNYKRAIAILNAAAKSFPGNPDVLKALASGYASVGLPKQAVDIFKSQDLSTGSAADYKSAVGAALAANDLKDAEVWLRFGLDQYPKDGQLLVLAAKFETARGDTGRAADYYARSLQVMPQDDPGLLLTDEMRHPVIVRRAAPAQPQDLASLLGQADPHVNRNGTVDEAPVAQRPYLPSYTGGGGNAPVVINGTGAGVYPSNGTYPGNGSLPQNVYPGYNTTQPPPQTNQPPQNSTLKDYVPQSRLEIPGQMNQTAKVVADTVIRLHPSPAMEAKYGPYVSYDPSAGVPHFAGEVRPLGDGVAVDAELEGVTARMITASYEPPQTTYTPPGNQPATGPQQTQSPAPANPSQQGTQVHPIHLHYPQPPRPGQASTAAQTTQPAGQGSTGQASSTGQAPGSGQRTGAVKISSTPPPASYPLPPAPSATSYPQETSGSQQGSSTPTGVLPDGTPIVSYLPNSKPGVRRRVPPRTPSAAVSARAAAILANQKEAPEEMTGQSHPPVENYDTTPDSNAQIQNTQFSSQPYSPAGMQGAQIPQAQAPRPGSTITIQNTQSYQGQSTAVQGQSTPVQQTGDSSGQQYPQPNTRGSSGTATTTTRRVASTSSTSSTTTTPAQPQPVGPIAYPNYAPPLANQGYPQIGSPYPLETPPTDYELQQRNVPPLRGYFDPRVDDKTPLTDRQQAELDLALIEGSYSAWMGGSVIGSYRSGTPGVDRLAGVEVPFEASAMLGRSVRVTAVPLAVFLNSGVLNTTTGTLGTTPIFGTVQGNSNQIYAQQFASGFGGEGQLTTSTFSIAGGYSAAGFLVRNAIGRVRWKPGNGHFTFFGGRDPVKETQLSYAGMRDPGQPNNYTLGPIWGGVVQTGGGIRLDAGNEKSGLYLQGDGADLSGYHVLENRKYEGTMGAYFRVKVWPEYGSLNVGGTIFGEHYDYNERVESYGNGGYFSPNIYFLFAVPITFNGHYKENLHYTINGSVGVQTFQEASDKYYPLDSGTETEYIALNCAGVVTSAAQPCGNTPLYSNTGLNSSIDAKLAYHVNEHWYIGAFLSGNNTNNYNTISGGFFARYLIRPQVQTVDYPTGLFPVEGFRPLRVP